MERIKAIPTLYEGYQFRSRLEARWAVFFDVLGIEWEYEPEGLLLSDGTQYLPDFYLPETKAFFEVKGVMDAESLHKILRLVADGYPVHVGYGPSKDYDGPRFRACSFTGFMTGNGSREYELDREDCSYLVRCRECGHFFFSGFILDICPCCGKYIRRKSADALDFLTGEGEQISPKYKFIFVEGYKSLVAEACRSFRNSKFDHGNKPDPRWRHDKYYRDFWVGFADVRGGL